MQTIDGRLIIIAGAARSGKTAYTVQQIRHAKRVVAWDPEDQWAQLPGWKRITSDAALFEAVQNPASAKLAFVPSGNLAAKFEFWANAVYIWGRYFGACVVVAEELADVTNTAKAPGSWGILLRRGLKRGITIYAISQRWAEADKTAIGNASEFVCFRQSSMQDIDYLSRRTRLPAEKLAALNNLEYLRLDLMDNGAITAGKLTFRKK